MMGAHAAEETMVERVQLVVTGRVQGVWYRASTKQEGSRLGLTGQVRNLPDGRVEVVAEGERATLEQLVAWCRRGPPLARVTDLQASWWPATGAMTGFEVRY
jgi:acylphosphatase